MTDYPVSGINWLLYGRGLDKKKFIDYHYRLGIPLTILNTWSIEDYQLISLIGTLTPYAIQLAHSSGFDVAPLRNIPHLDTPGLLIMDMDSTMIQIECIDEIAKIIGCGNKITKITECAMRGEIDFKKSLYERVAILKGTDVNVLQQVLNEMPLMSGLSNLIQKLHNFGWYIAIASSGFKFYTDFLSKKFHLSASVANKLEIRDGKLTGNILGKIVDSQFKLDTLKHLIKYFNILPKQTVAIGDGINDLKMIKYAKLGIAYHAKSIVNEQANVMIYNADLMGVFCILSSSLIH